MKRHALHFHATTKAIVVLCFSLYGCRLRDDPSPLPPPEGANIETREQQSLLPAPIAPAASPLTPTSVTAEEVLERGTLRSKRGFIVNAWASWCGPCRREFPMLVELAPRFRELGIEVLFVSVDDPETVPVALDFAQRHEQKGELLVAAAPLSAFKQGLNPRWPGMLPATFLYDAEGKLRYFWGGPVYEEEITPVLLALARGEPVQGEATFGLTPGRDMRDEAP